MSQGSPVGTNDAPIRLEALVHGWFAVLAACVFALITWPLFPSSDAMRSALHPAVFAGCCWAGQLWYATRVSIAQTGRTVREDLTGVANTVTLFRGGLFGVVIGFVVVPPDTALIWIPALCYGIGVCLDYIDGALAQTIGRETRVGTRLDMAFDTFGFVAAPLVAVVWGRLPAWYLTLSILRYAYRAGLYYRRRRDRPVYDRPDSDLGKYLAGLQMAFLTVALAPVVPATLVRTVAPAVLAPSVVVFCRDFLVASGRVPHVDSSGGN